MTVPAIVALDAKPQRICFEDPAVQRDVSRKNGVGMRRA